MKILLKRHRRIGKKLHYRGSVIEVDYQLGEEMVRRGSAVEVDPVPVVNLNVDSQDDAPEDDQDTGDDISDDDDVNQSGDDAPEDDQDDAGAPRKPLKTDKIAVFQAWARHLGDNPDGKKLDELKALYL